MEPIAANISLGEPGLVSDRLKQAYRNVLTELSQPATNRPGEPFAPQSGLESLATRLLKQSTWDIPKAFLMRGGEMVGRAWEGERVNPLEVTGLAAEATMLGSLGSGPSSPNVLGMGGRAPMKGFYSPLQRSIRQVIKEEVQARRPTKFPFEQVPEKFKKIMGEGVNPALQRYATTEDKAYQLHNFGEMTPMTGKVAPTETTNVYRPAVRMDDGTILWHPKARMHADAISMQPEVAKTGKFNFDKVSGSGGIGPDGRYYESAFLGDVEPGMVEGVTQGKFTENLPTFKNTQEVLYHGTNLELRSFKDLPEGHRGYFATTDKAAASKFGKNVYETSIDKSKIFDARNKEDLQKFITGFRKRFPDRSISRVKDMLESGNHAFYEAPQTKFLLEDLGYKGNWQTEGNSSVYRVFSKEQLSSEGLGLIKENPELGAGLKPQPSRAVSLPGQVALNRLEKMGVSPAEFDWTGVGEMLKGGTEPIPLKDVMRKAIEGEIKVGERKLEGASTQYSNPSYRKPFKVSEDIPYEETVLTLKGGKGTSFEDPSHYPDIENLIAWSRSEIRPGSKGENIRMAQEFQEGKWGITGRKKGFQDKAFLAKKESLEEEVSWLENKRQRLETQERRLDDLHRRSLRKPFLTTAEEQERTELIHRTGSLASDIAKTRTQVLKLQQELHNPVPDTPFKFDAVKLAIKKELYEAAKDPTVTHFAWTTPEQQKIRWPDERGFKNIDKIYRDESNKFIDSHLKRLAEGGPLGKQATPERMQQIADQYKAGLITKAQAKQMRSGIIEEAEVLKGGGEFAPVPTIKLDDWIRSKILKGQPISKVDNQLFRDALV